MSTSPTFNTVTARTINLNNPGQMSAAGTVIARDFTATGNIVANNGAARRASFSQVTATGNVTGANFITLGVVNAVTQIRSTQIIANNSMSIGSTTTIQNSGVTTANLIATGNVTGSNFFTAGRVSATGNVAGNYILGNGYFLTGLAGGVGTYGNSNVAQYLPTYTGALTGSNLTVGSSTLINNNLSLQNIVAAANITAGRINSTTMSLSGNVLSPITVSGNVTGTNLNTSGQMSATGNVQGGNLRTVGIVSAIGNITGNYIFGNGAFLTGIANSGAGSGSYGNANVAAYLPTYTGNLNPTDVSATGNLAAASLQIGSSTLTTNSLSVPLDVVAGRNISGANLFGTLRTAIQPNITQIGNLSALRVNGEITATSLALSGPISTTGTVTGGTITGTGLSVSGTGIIGTVQILNSAITGAASVTATGNVSGGALRSSGIVSAVGAITGASVSAAGNVTGLNLVGNGYSLTNVLRSNTTRTVYVSTAAPTAGQGVNGDIWYQTY